MTKQRMTMRMMVAAAILLSLPLRTAGFGTLPRRTAPRAWTGCHYDEPPPGACGDGAGPAWAGPCEPTCNPNLCNPDKLLDPTKFEVKPDTPPVEFASTRILRVHWILCAPPARAASRQHAASPQPAWRAVYCTQHACRCL